MITKKVGELGDVPPVLSTNFIRISRANSYGPISFQGETMLLWMLPSRRHDSHRHHIFLFYFPILTCGCDLTWVTKTSLSCDYLAKFIFMLKKYADDITSTLQQHSNQDNCMHSFNPLTRRWESLYTTFLGSNWHKKLTFSLALHIILDNKESRLVG